MITVVTPFSRKENLELMANHLKEKVNWIVLVDNPELVSLFPEWVTVKFYDKPVLKEGESISNTLFNKFIDEGLDDETQYMILCDDDFVEEGFWQKIPDEDVVITSMKRNDWVSVHPVWDDWASQTNHLELGEDILVASPENLKIARVGGEQLILKGRILKNYRYGLSNVGDGEMILQVVKDHKPVFVPDAYVLFNYLEEGRFKSFRRKPLVLFVGDFYCAGTEKMGKSEWEGNLWASLESTDLVNVARFHMDKYYGHFGKRGDEALIKSIKSIRPDYVLMVIYKQPGFDPTVVSLETIVTIASMNIPIISIWGDLEAEEQQALAKGLEPFMWKIVGTANKALCERFGYTYMHVPKDPRVFNNPDKERDIDIVFSGSYGYGREERQKYMNHLLNNGIRLIHGGSEGGDHFTTEDYADRYKRAKLALSFSQARGMNVVNARPFEVMNCGAMLLEQESLELAKLYTPFIDYVPWTTEDDLLNKVRYYLEHDDERKLIANNGYRKTQELYSAQTFWKKVLNK